MDSGDRSFPDRGLFQSAARHLFRKRRDKPRPDVPNTLRVGTNRGPVFIQVHGLDSCAIFGRTCHPSLRR